MGVEGSHHRHRDRGSNRGSLSVSVATEVGRGELPPPLSVPERVYKALQTPPEKREGIRVATLRPPLTSDINYSIKDIQTYFIAVGDGTRGLVALKHSIPEEPESGSVDALLSGWEGVLNQEPPGSPLALVRMLEEIRRANKVIEEYRTKGWSTNGVRALRNSLLKSFMKTATGIEGRYDFRYLVHRDGAYFHIQVPPVVNAYKMVSNPLVEPVFEERRRSRKREFDGEGFVLSPHDLIHFPQKDGVRVPPEKSPEDTTALGERTRYYDEEFMARPRPHPLRSANVEALDPYNNTPPGLAIESSEDPFDAGVVHEPSVAEAQSSEGVIVLDETPSEGADIAGNPENAGLGGEPADVSESPIVEPVEEVPSAVLPDEPPVRGRRSGKSKARRKKGREEQRQKSKAASRTESASMADNPIVTVFLPAEDSASTEPIVSREGRVSPLTKKQRRAANKARLVRKRQEAERQEAEPSASPAQPAGDTSIGEVAVVVFEKDDVSLPVRRGPARTAPESGKPKRRKLPAKKRVEQSYTLDEYAKRVGRQVLEDRSGSSVAGLLIYSADSSELQAFAQQPVGDQLRAALEEIVATKDQWREQREKGEAMQALAVRHALVLPLEERAAQEIDLQVRAPLDAEGKLDLQGDPVPEQYMIYVLFPMQNGQARLSAPRHAVAFADPKMPQTDARVKEVDTLVSALPSSDLVQESPTDTYERLSQELLFGQDAINRLMVKEEFTEDDRGQLQKTVDGQVLLLARVFSLVDRHPAFVGLINATLGNETITFSLRYVPGDIVGEGEAKGIRHPSKIRLRTADVATRASGLFDDEQVSDAANILLDRLTQPKKDSVLFAVVRDGVEVQLTFEELEALPVREQLRAVTEKRFGRGEHGRKSERRLKASVMRHALLLSSEERKEQEIHLQVRAPRDNPLDQVEEYFVIALFPGEKGYMRASRSSIEALDSRRNVDVDALVSQGADILPEEPIDAYVGTIEALRVRAEKNDEGTAGTVHDTEVLRLLQRAFDLCDTVVSRISEKIVVDRDQDSLRITLPFVHPIPALGSTDRTIDHGESAGVFTIPISAASYFASRPEFADYR